MVDSPTPYLRLDDEDRIVDVNPAFCVKLGYPPDTLSMDELKTRTLQSLCADVHSYNTYERVQELRRRNKEVRPYTLNLSSRYGYPVSFRVVSAGIPAARRGDLPETFGIFLDGEMPTTPNEASEQSSVTRAR
jgi:PAS domain-containing protein